MNRARPLRGDVPGLRLGLLAGLGVLAFGCGHGSAPPEGSVILTRSKALADQMCSCKDKACGTPLRGEWDELTKTASASFTPEQVEVLAQQDQRFFNCMAALDGAK